MPCPRRQKVHCSELNVVDFKGGGSGVSGILQKGLDLAKGVTPPSSGWLVWPGLILAMGYIRNNSVLQLFPGNCSSYYNIKKLRQNGSKKISLAVNFACGPVCRHPCVNVDDQHHSNTLRSTLYNSENFRQRHVIIIWSKWIRKTIVENWVT